MKPLLPPLWPRQRQMRGLVCGLILLVLGGVALLPPVSKGIPGMAPCVFHSLTGLPCPLCGGTRAASALLRGDLDRTMHLNALAFPAVALLLLLAILCGVEAVRGRPFADWVTWSRHLRWGIPLALLLLLLWWIPHLGHALRDSKTELLDLRNPIARKLNEGMRAGTE
jgi:hypothetical protein